MAQISVDNVDAAYGDLQVLWDASMTVEEDDNVVALIGPNGAGKSTLLKTISGHVAVSSGSVEVFGEDVSALSPAEIVKRGFVLVPEGRHLFSDMTVMENLEMGAYTQREQFEATLEEVFDLFPVLEERKTQKAGTMSGGEQQMLAIGKGLMTRPKVLALDEPSSALAPKLAQRVFDKIDDISNEITVLLVEQHVHEALELAERAYLLENGQIVSQGPSEELLGSDHIEQAYLSG